MEDATEEEMVEYEGMIINALSRSAGDFWA